jgi:uncharacterized protein YegP (UPF0339 family)
MARRHIKIFEDKGHKWRWHMKASNGQIIATSGEGYETKQGAREAVHRLLGYTEHVVVNVGDDDEDINSEYS